MNNYDLSFAFEPSGGHPTLHHHPTLTPYPYQVAAVQQVGYVRPHTYCAHVPGSGKTPIALMASCHYTLHEPVLVVCPPSIVYQWAKQAKLWTGVPWFVATTAKEVRRFLSEPAHTLPARFIVPDSLLHAIPETEERFALIIADEAHRLKGRDARRTRAFFGGLGSAGLRRRADKVLALSGTPMPNNPTELYPFLHACYPEIAPTFSAFAYRYCPPTEIWANGIARIVYKNAINKVELAKKLRSSCMIRPRREDILGQLPPLREDSLPIRIGITGGMTPEDVINTWNHGDPEAKIALATARHHLGVAKATECLPYLQDILDGGDAPLIWCWHREAAELIAAKLNVPLIHGGKTPEDRRDAIAEFVTGGAKALVCTIQAAGEGIDGLQRRTDLCIFVERSYVPKDQEQAIARLHRLGQRSSVRVVIVESDHPIDRAIAVTLTRKQSDISEIVG